MASDAVNNPKICAGKRITANVPSIIIVVGIVLLLTGGADDKTSAENMGGESYAVVLDK